MRCETSDIEVKLALADLRREDRPRLFVAEKICQRRQGTGFSMLLLLEGIGVRA